MNAPLSAVDGLEQLQELAQRAGIGVRFEWLGGVGGGRCRIGGKEWIFLDLSLTVPEQLDQLAESLRNHPIVESLIDESLRAA